MPANVNLPMLLSATIDTVQRHARMIVIFLAVMIPLSAASAFFETGEGSNLATFDYGLRITDSLIGEGPLAVIVVVGSFLVGLVAQYWLLAGMTRDTPAPGFDRFWQWLGIYLLSLLAIGFGFVLLIIPGIILIVRWTPLLPAVVDRNERAFDAFGDSWEMTDGKGWSIFGAMAIIVVVFWIGASVVVGLSLTGAGIVLGAVASAIIEQISTIIFTALSVGTYNLLRDDSETLTDIFE